MGLLKAAADSFKAYLDDVKGFLLFLVCVFLFCLGLYLVGPHG